MRDGAENLPRMGGCREDAGILKILVGGVFAMAFLIGERDVECLECGRTGDFAVNGISKKEVPLTGAGRKDEPDHDQE